MNKRTANFVITFLVTAVLALSLADCRRDPPIKKPNNSGPDPDSLYVGTPYTLLSTRPGGPFMFGNVQSPYKDSMTLEGIELGRRLFYDQHLSVSGTKSCGSCHKLANAMSDAPNVLSLNETGTTKRNAPAIQNLAWAPKLFWDGRSNTLADQAADAYQHELVMNVGNTITYLKSDSTYIRLFKKAFGRPGTITDTKIYLAVQQFMMSAISSNSHFDKVMRGQESFTASEQYAFDTLFRTEKGDCFHCHAFGASLLMVDYSVPFRNNGLDAATTISDFKDPGRGGFTGSAVDYGKFKNPTLRNVALTAPYMHDGRYTTLRQVLNFYSDSLHYSPGVDQIIINHLDTIHVAGSNGLDSIVRFNHGGLHLTERDKDALIDLLNAMTDTTFANNPALKDPF